MSRSDALTPAEQELSAATRALVRAFGGQEAAAEATGTRQQRISDFGLPNVREFAPVDFIDALESMTVDLPGWPHVTRVLARRRGFLLVERVTAPGDEDLRLGVAAMAAELGDVARRINEGLSNDGAIDAAEAADILVEIEQLEQCTARMRMRLQGIVAAGVTGGVTGGEARRK